MQISKTMLNSAKFRQNINPIWAKFMAIYFYMEFR